MIRINLLPVRAAQKKEKLVSQVLVLVLALVLTVLACGFVHFSLAGKISDQKVENKKIKKELSSLQKKIGQVGKFKKLQKELKGKLDVLEKLKEAKTGPVHLLDELTLALPDKLWINSYKEANGNVSIQGVGLNEENVARFMESLEESPYYRNVNLVVVEQRSVKGNKIQNFNLSMNVESPGQKE